MICPLRANCVRLLRILPRFTYLEAAIDSTAATSTEVCVVALVNAPLPPAPAPPKRLGLSVFFVFVLQGVLFLRGVLSLAMCGPMDLSAAKELVRRPLRFHFWPRSSRDTAPLLLTHYLMCPLLCIVLAAVEGTTASGITLVGAKVGAGLQIVNNEFGGGQVYQIDELWPSFNTASTFEETLTSGRDCQSEFNISAASHECLGACDGGHVSLTWHSRWCGLLWSYIYDHCGTACIHSFSTGYP